MYLQFHSVKEPSKNHNIRVRVLFGSLQGRDVGFGSLRVLLRFYFRVRIQFGSWQNLGSGSVRTCWVRVLSHLQFTTLETSSCHHRHVHRLFLPQHNPKRFGHSGTGILEHRPQNRCCCC